MLWEMRELATRPAIEARGAMCAANTTGRSHLLAWHSSLDLDLLFVQLLHNPSQKHVVNRLDRPKGHKTESTRAAAVRVIHHNSILHLPILLKIFPEGFLIHGRRKPADKDLLHLGAVPTHAILSLCHILTRDSFFRLHLSAIDRVLKRHDFVGNVRLRKHNESKPARASSVLVVTDEGLQHFAVVLEILAQLLIGGLPAKSADENFAAGLGTDSRKTHRDPRRGRARALPRMEAGSVCIWRAPVPVGGWSGRVGAAVQDAVEHALQIRGGALV
mmetsp:Transcript_830/g.2509  ORF Transcript_830/g.2509 Transcript_830/m.2509 type:complete len:274 (-) Transcript_830:1172-1993(-)